MRTIALVFVSFCFVTAAFAEDSCKVQATGKSLHGAALTSFAKKCCKDQAAAQKLHGAAAFLSEDFADPPGGPLADGDGSGHDKVPVNGVIPNSFGTAHLP